MSSRRRKAREAALKALYQVDLVGENPLVALDALLDEEVLKPILEPLGRELALNGGLLGDSTREEIEVFTSDFVCQFINDRLFEKVESGNENAVHDFVSRFLRPGVNSNEVLSAFIKRLKDKLAAFSEVRYFSRLIVDRTLEHKAHIDDLLGKFALNWALDRMASLDRSILRSAVCELLFFPDIPVNVTLNESIELAKKYSTERSAEFVNGILDKVQRETKPQKEEPAARRKADEKIRDEVPPSRDPSLEGE
ncbi:MAG: transcription antitermination factor NusB [Candidatus Riflebacteria bacterium]|nr:transcription antitermination factor NusB [Candidatus Riflebacteria bacterium]